MLPGVLLYDGHCRLCVRGAKRLAALARPASIEARDFQVPAVLAAYPQVSYEECMQAMPLVTTDGRVFRGAEAIARALATRRVAGVLARLYYVPGVRALCDALYRWVARNRYRMFGHAESDCDDGACALHRPGRP